MKGKGKMRGLLTKANEVVRQNIKNGKYYVCENSEWKYFVYLEKCRNMQKGASVAYLTREAKDNKERNTRLTFKVPIKWGRTFTEQDLKKYEKRIKNV